ncbi:hypothetical protein THRCLA_21712 [Thraustotheca clavata]|uniref:Uncharacterized protein n=1 Tax=Thraustotheca clavata TaxID=74557 RepID=A0A1V9ZQH9_9STRA|nr:hypothetical protein THRCLA_21712 [Thraustotheca clavata]
MICEIICRQCSRKFCLVTKQLRHNRKNGTMERHIKVCSSCFTNSVGTEKTLIDSPQELPEAAPFFACTTKIPILEDMTTSNNTKCTSGSSFMEDIETLYVQTNEQAIMETSNSGHATRSYIRCNLQTFNQRL